MMEWHGRLRFCPRFPLIQFDQVLSLLKVSEYLRKEWLEPPGVLLVVVSNSMFLKSSSFVIIMS